jgi:hypothetical protein
MPTLVEILERITVDINQLLLDPNNPRFTELGESPDQVPESRFGEEKVQNEAIRKMKSEKFDVAELRDTIRTLGFLPIDKVVVKPWESKTSGKFVVIEGNRRITALKWLIELHETGKETLSEELLKNIRRFEVLNITDDSNPALIKWIIPGLRHVSGIKEWGPYQKAKAVFNLRESGRSPQEAAQSLGLSTTNANRLWRAFLALEQMHKDEDIGEYVTPKLYSYFEEVFKKQHIRAWLDWGDDSREFKNKINLKEFYSWILGELNEDGVLGDPKLPEAKSIRELDTFFNDTSAMNIFRQKNGSLSKALARYEIDHPEEWRPIVKQTVDMLSSISAESLKSMVEDDIIILESLKNKIQSLINDRAKLLG